MKTKTLKYLRSFFWATHPEFVRKGRSTQNSYPTDIRVTWCDFVDSMRCDNVISAKLADRATL